MQMYLWKISQDVNNGWDTYDSAVVAAKTEEEARNIHPDPYGNFMLCEEFHPRTYGSWCARQDVKVEMIGVAVDGTLAGVIVASFKAG